MQLQNQHKMLSAIMWRPYLVSELSISFKVFGGCTFISFTFVHCRYMCTWDGYKGGITAH